MAKQEMPKEYMFEGRNSGHFTWIIENKETIQKMFAATNGQEFCSESFEMANLRWKLDLYPNGHRKQDKGHVCLFLHLLEMPSALEHITGSQIFTFGDYMAIFGHKFRFPTTDGGLPSWGFHSDHNRIPLSFWMKSVESSIRIGVSINVFSVKWNKKVMENILIYQNPLPICSNYKHVDIPSTITETWQINGKCLAAFKKASNGQIFLSPIYRNMWQFSCYPNGQSEDEEGYVSLYVQLVNPPPFVKSVDCKVRMNIPYTNSNTRYEFNYEYHHGQLWGYPNLFPLSRLKDAESVDFGVSISTNSNRTVFFEGDEADESIVYDPVQISHILSGQIQEDAVPKTYENMITLEHEADIQDLSKRMDSMEKKENDESRWKRRVYRIEKDLKQQLSQMEKRLLKIENAEIDNMMQRVNGLESNMNRLMTNQEEQKQVETTQVSDMMERMDRWEKELKTQYKPRIQSLWSGLQGIDKVTKEHSAHIARQRQLMENEQKDDMLRSMAKRIETLEMKVDQLLNDKIQNMNESPGLQAVRRWMRNEVKLPQYLDLLIANGYDDLSVIQDLSIMDLEEMGIEKKGHRMRIVKAISNLKAAMGTKQKRSTLEGAAWI